MSQKLNDFYRRVLKIAGLVVDSTGSVSAQIKDITSPFMIGEKRLVLPTPENLAKFRVGDVEIFHPLNESIVRNETPVLVRYRQALNVRLNYTLMTLFTELLVFATSPSLHDRCKPEHLELLKLMGNATETILPKFEKVIRHVKAGTAKCFVNVYLKKGGKAQGKSCYRAAVVSFPIWEQIEKGENTIWDVAFNKKEFVVLKDLFAYILPGIGMDDGDHFTHGSLSTGWASIEALLKSMRVLAASINSVVFTFQDVIDSLQELAFTDDWVDDVDNLEKYKADALMIPQLGSNMGEPVAATPATPVPQQLTTPIPGPMGIPAAVPFQAPVYASTPTAPPGRTLTAVETAMQARGVASGPSMQMQQYAHLPPSRRPIQQPQPFNNWPQIGVQPMYPQQPQGQFNPMNTGYGGYPPPKI